MRILKAIIEFVMEIMETIVFVGSLFIVVYLFIAQPNQIRGVSMEPTFQEGNFIFTSLVTYKFRKPERGDIVVFYAPRNPELEYIKRVIAIPGDTVKIQGQQVYVNDIAINEPYISAQTEIIMGGSLTEGQTITIAEDHVFVMGDNRPKSSDSRDFGPIPYSAIVGQVFYRYFPPEKMGNINNPYDVRLQSSSINLAPGVNTSFFWQSLPTASRMRSEVLSVLP